MHEHGYGDVRQQPTKSNDVKRTLYAQSDAPLQPSHKLVDVKASDTVEKLSERMLKLKELEILVNKHYAPQNAKQIIITACIQANLGDDYSLHKYLTFLRNIDRARSY